MCQGKCKSYVVFLNYRQLFSKIHLLKDTLPLCCPIVHLFKGSAIPFLTRARDYHFITRFSATTDPRAQEKAILHNKWIFQVYPNYFVCKAEPYL